MLTLILRILIISFIGNDSHRNGIGYFTIKKKQQFDN